MAEPIGEVTLTRWQQAKAIVADALEETMPSARAAMIVARCGNDAELLSEVESLLKQPTDSIENSALKANKSLRPEISVLAPGYHVGAYMVVRELGRGGRERSTLQKERTASSKSRSRLSYSSGALTRL